MGKVRVNMFAHTLTHTHTHQSTYIWFLGTHTNSCPGCGSHAAHHRGNTKVTNDYRHVILQEDVTRFQVPVAKNSVCPNERVKSK